MSRKEEAKAKKRVVAPIRKSEQRPEMSVYDTHPLFGRKEDPRVLMKGDSWMKTIFAPAGRVSVNDFWMILIGVLAVSYGIHWLENHYWPYPYTPPPAKPRPWFDPGFLVRPWEIPTFTPLLGLRLVMFAPLVYVIINVLIKRLHDRDRPWLWILLALTPLPLPYVVEGFIAVWSTMPVVMEWVLGFIFWGPPIWLIIEVAFKPGDMQTNRYGADPTI